MKISRLKKDVIYGIGFAQELKRNTSREDMIVVRCILCKDIHNIPGVLKFLGIFPDRYNEAIKTGIFIELIK